MFSWAFDSPCTQRQQSIQTDSDYTTSKLGNSRLLVSFFAFFPVKLVDKMFNFMIIDVFPILQMELRNLTHPLAT